jgi:hypothetical protein
MAPFKVPLTPFNCYIDQVFLFNSSAYDNAFAKVAILKRAVHFESAQELTIPEADIDEFIQNALNDLALLQQQKWNEDHPLHPPISPGRNESYDDESDPTPVIGAASTAATTPEDNEVANITTATPQPTLRRPPNMHYPRGHDSSAITTEATKLIHTPPPNFKIFCDKFNFQRSDHRQWFSEGVRIWPSIDHLNIPKRQTTDLTTTMVQSLIAAKILRRVSRSPFVFDTFMIAKQDVCLTFRR